jgi:formyltetrahydrofolate deformylase
MSCSDRAGVIATVTGSLFQRGANILSLEQHVEEDGQFFMRIRFVIADGDLEQANLALQNLKEKFSAVILTYNLEKPVRTAILVSKESACLYELMQKNKAGELRAEIAFVISNHRDLEKVAEHFSVPFIHMPIVGGDKSKQEENIIKLLKSEDIELVVLARYMQVLTQNLVSQFKNQIINIHHGFLPAFKGARPYAQAKERGVKLIGATAHYVTEELDDGPIIEQDVIRVSHQQEVEDLKNIGRDIERRVLATAVLAHLDHRIMNYKKRTIVFAQDSMQQTRSK